jgi:hypothetical protein
MINVIVQRGDGNILGEEISNTLITSDGIAIQRGRAEIDRSTKVTLVRLKTRYRADARPGMTALVLDAMQGAAWYGKVTSVDFSYDNGVLTSSLQVERPL